MTDEQLKQGQELKRTIKLLESEIEKFDTTNPNGVNVFIPNVGTLIENVRIDFLKQLDKYNRQFKEL